MDKKKLTKVKRAIFRQFPEFKGVEPKIIEKEIVPKTSVYRKLTLGTPPRKRKIVRMKFTKMVTTADRTELERILLVTLDEHYEIIKITESR
ncbi:MAG: hypothetical protein JSW02_04535 [candidate division WOR-3 bacterium]|nr:MAG: hypothetical protein JSW02_04535 [candidate division WOR-3 bacterium]